MNSFLFEAFLWAVYKAGLFHRRTRFSAGGLCPVHFSIRRKWKPSKYFSGTWRWPLEEDRAEIYFGCSNSLKHNFPIASTASVTARGRALSRSNNISLTKDLSVWCQFLVSVCWSTLYCSPLHNCRSVIEVKYPVYTLFRLQKECNQHFICERSNLEIHFCWRFRVFTSTPCLLSSGAVV